MPVQPSYWTGADSWRTVSGVDRVSAPQLVLYFGAREVLGSALPQIGPYSYNEISPHSVSGMCELHNQTMTITVLSET